MSDLVRRAGRVTLHDGTQLVWSAADGRRGRRWRAITTRDGQPCEALLLEIGLDGRPTRLELTTSAGLLTLHPEPSGSLHGNVVTSGGVRHLASAWTDAHELAIDRLPMAAAVTIRRLASTLAVGEGRSVPVVTVASDLEVRDDVRRYERLTEVDWRIDGPDGSQALTVDDRGLPIWSDTRGESGGAGEASSAADEWPLELETPI